MVSRVWGGEYIGRVRLGLVRSGSAGLGFASCGWVRQARRGLARYGRSWSGKVSYGKAGEVGCVTASRVMVWFGTAGMEGHRVVRLDVVCYVIVGLGVSGFAWFGSVGLAWFGEARSGLARRGVVRQARRVPARLGVVR